MINPTRLAEIAAQVDRETPDWREHVRIIKPQQNKRYSHKCGRPRVAIVEIRRDGTVKHYQDMAAASYAAGYKSADAVREWVRDGSVCPRNGSRYKFACDFEKNRAA